MNPTISGVIGPGFLNSGSYISDLALQDLVGASRVLGF